MNLARLLRLSSMDANLRATSASPSNHLTIKRDLAFRCKFITDKIICLFGRIQNEMKLSIIRLK